MTGQGNNQEKGHALAYAAAPMFIRGSPITTLGDDGKGKVLSGTELNL